MSDRMNKLVYPYNEVLLSNKKEWVTDTRHIVDEPQQNYAE